MNLLLFALLLAQPQPCGTVERLAQMRTGQRFDRPGVGQRQIGSQHFIVHYDTSGRHQTTRAYAESVQVYAERAWRRQVDTLGWAEPPPDDGGPDGREDIYLEDTTAWNGLCTGEDYYDNPYPDGRTSYIEIRTGLNFVPLRFVIAHEFNHACQFRYSDAEWLSFYDNTAEWMGDWSVPEQGQGAWWLNGYRHPLDSTHFGLNHFTYPGWLWLRFLHEYYSPDCPRAVWEQLGIEEDENTLWGMWVALWSSYQSSLERAFGHYAVWRYFTGARDDSRHFLDAEDWQTSRSYYNYSQYPVEDSAVNYRPAAPGGCAFVSFTGFGTNRVRIFFDGEDGQGWSVYVLGVGSVTREYLVLLPNSADTGSIVIPGRQYQTIVLVPVATQLTVTGGLRFRWQVTLGGDSTGIHERPSVVGAELSCRSRRGEAAFEYGLAAGVAGRLTVFDLLGSVRYSQPVVGNGQVAEVSWPNGGVRGGVYFCRLSSGSAEVTRKFVVTKEK